MNAPIVIALSLIFASFTTGDDVLDKIERSLDRQLYDRAPVVVRALITSDGAADGEGAKYLWANAVIHAFWKMPKETKISPILRIAYQSDGQGLPKGDATLYLEPYHPEKPELGWKLVEVLEQETQKLSRGYSHHSSGQKEEPAGTGQPATRPESKSEGGDKPQPEAEERSR